MRATWLWGVFVAAGLVFGGAVPGQAQKDPTRDIFLQTIGLLAGQGLVTGYENLEGIAARFDRRLLPRDRALEALAAARRYVDLVLSTFSNHLMGQLTGEEKKDLSLLIGFYETHREAIITLADYVRSGGNKKKRLPFEEKQAQVAAIIRQISLANSRPPEPAAGETKMPPAAGGMMSPDPSRGE